MHTALTLPHVSLAVSVLLGSLHDLFRDHTAETFVPPKILATNTLSAADYLKQLVATLALVTVSVPTTSGAAETYVADKTPIAMVILAFVLPIVCIKSTSGSRTPSRLTACTPKQDACLSNGYCSSQPPRQLDEACVTDAQCPGESRCTRGECGALGGYCSADTECGANRECTMGRLGCDQVVKLQ
jgi:hypothetical protein